MNVLLKKLVDEYTEDDKTFNDKVQTAIDTYLAAMKPSTSKIDPQRLGTKAGFLSHLKSALKLKLGPVEVDDQPEFNEMTLEDQLKFQMRSRMSNKNKWVHDISILPENMQDISMPGTQFAQLGQIRLNADKSKLNDKPTEIDGDALMAKILPLLMSKKPVLKEIIPALLLATGRRSIEILKTGSFHLTADMDKDAYTCMFDGQAKAGLDGDKPYQIPLLAPYWMVQAAMTNVRNQIDSEGVNEDVHARYGHMLNQYVHKLAGVTPHSLRSIYAMTCYRLWGSKKASMIGFISRILGQAHPTNASYYQRVDLTVTKPWEPSETIEAAEDADTEDFDLNAETLPERKAAARVIEIMRARRPVTASAIKARGGSMNMAVRIIEMNLARIDAYNDSLAPEDKAPEVRPIDKDALHMGKYNRTEMHDFLTKIRAEKPELWEHPGVMFVNAGVDVPAAGTLRKSEWIRRVSRAMGWEKEEKKEEKGEKGEKDEK